MAEDIATQVELSAFGFAARRAVSAARSEAAQLGVDVLDDVRYHTVAAHGPRGERPRPRVLLRGMRDRARHRTGRHRSGMRIGQKDHAASRLLKA